MNTQQVKWILLMYGPLLAARGDIAVLAGKLGTGLHLGTVKPTFRNNTEVYKSLVASTLTIAMLDAFLVGIITYIMNLLIFPVGIKVLNPTLFLVIPLIVMSVTALISTQITCAVSFFTYRKGLNPDVYVIPVMSTVNNILITVIYAGTLAILRPWGGQIELEGETILAVAEGRELLGAYIAIIPAVLSLVGILYVIMKNRKDYEYRKMMKEAILAVFASALIGTITGFTLSKGELAIETYPQLLVAFPALIGTVVDQNAITANILITDFSAGITEPSIKSFKKPKVWTTYLGIAAGGAVITAFLTIIGTFITWNQTTYKWHLIIIIAVTVLAGLIAYILVGSLIFVLSIFAFKREIDPDNFAIPLTACLADLATASLIIAFSFAFLLPLSAGHAESVVAALVGFLS